MPDLQGVHPEVARRFSAFSGLLRAYGYTVQVTSGFRSIEKQTALYQARQRGEHPLPVARPGCSEHNHGLAIDAVVNLPNHFIGPVARAFGLVWAGPADPVHYGVFTQGEWGKIVHDEKLC